MYPDSVLRQALLAALAWLAIAIAACGTAAEATQAPALPPAPAGSGLRAIQDRGRLIVGVKYDVPTFGALESDGRVTGFDADLARMVARDILGSVDAIEFRPAATQDRIPLLDSGAVDLVVSTMTANQERARQVDFSAVYYVAGQRLLVLRSNSAISSVADVAGRRVGTVRGSTSETNLRDAAPSAQIVPFATYSEAVAELEAGRLDAVTTDDSILLGFAQRAPARLKLVGPPFTVEPYAMAVRPGNSELLAAVDASLQRAKQSGEWARRFARTFGPLGVTTPPPPPQAWQAVYDAAQAPGR